MQILIESSVRIVLLAAALAAVLKLLRVTSPRVAHLAWFGLTLVMLLLPAIVAWAPQVELPLLPSGPQDVVVKLPSDDVAIAPAGDHAMVGKVASGSWTLGWRQAAWFVYLAGAALLLARLGVGLRRARQLTREATRVRGRLTHPACVSPITVGLAEPVVILPPAWVSWPAAELAAVLAHEQEHVRRRDPLIAFVVLVNRALFWFHPLAWWLPREVSRLSEEACDTMVLSRGHDAGAYSRLLVRFARATANAGARLEPLGTAMPGSGLPARLRLLERGPAPAPPPSRLILTAAAYAAAIVICAGVTMVPSDAGAAPPPPAQAAAASWDVHESDHFEIYFESALEPLLADVERQAEDAYAHVSAVLKHEVRERVPLILVPTNRALTGDLQQGGDLPARAGAPARTRVVLSVEAVQATPRLVVHELTHHFLLEILPAVSRSEPWLIEGLAEHLRGAWSAADVQRTRAAVARRQLPALDGLTAADGYWGHVLFDFVASERGEEGIRRFLFALRNASRPDDAIPAAFGTTAADFLLSFHAYVRTRFGPP